MKTTMTTSKTSMWPLADVVSAINAPTITVVGHLALGRGVATLPDVRDGWPVQVPLCVALEAIQRYGGHCWVAYLPSLSYGGVRLIGDDDPVSPEALPKLGVQRVLGAPLAEKIAARGLALWWAPTLEGLWLGAVHPDGVAAGVDARDYLLRVVWVEGGEAWSAESVDEAPDWAMESIAIAREVLGV